MSNPFSSGVAQLAILCFITGMALGYAVHRVGLRGWVALAAVLTVTYLASMLAILLRGAMWVRRAAQKGGVAAISVDVSQEVLVFEVTLVISGLAYAVALAAPERWGLELPLVIAGGTCGLSAILTRIAQRPRTTETAG